MLERRPEKYRTIFVVLWISIFILSQAVLAVYCITNSVTGKFTKDTIMLVLTGALSMVNLMSLMAIWYWWKWGFYALGVGIVGITVLAIAGLPVPVIWVFGLLAGYIVTILLTRSIWYYFE